MIIIFEVTAILPVGPWSKEEGTKKEKKNYLKKHKSHLAFSVLVFLETLQKFPNILEHYLHIPVCISSKIESPPRKRCTYMLIRIAVYTKSSVL